MKEKIKRSDFKIILNSNELTEQGRQRILNHYTPNFPEFYEKWGEQGLTQANIKQGKIVRRTTLEALGETHMGFHICYGFAEWEGGKQIKPGFNAFAFKLSDFKEYEIQEITYTTVKIVG